MQLIPPCVLLTSHVGSSCVDFRRSSHLTHFHCYATYRLTFRVANSKKFTENDLVFDPSKMNSSLGILVVDYRPTGMKQADMKQFWSHIARFQVCPLFGKAETWQLTLNLKCKYAVTCADWPGWVLPCELLPF